MKLTKEDFALIEAAREAIRKNYDADRFRHTVGSAVRCADGKIYTGVNLYTVHSVCAEHAALGAAITQGEREFSCIVAVTGKNGEEIIPPCGNCRQILSDFAPDCMVIVQDSAEPKKLSLSELLPFAYVEGAQK